MSCPLCPEAKLSFIRTLKLQLLALLLIVSCQSYGAFDGFIEIVEVEGCHDTKFSLTCRKLDTHIAIMEGFYLTRNDSEDLLLNSTVTSCGITPFQASYQSSAAITRSRIHQYSSNNESVNIRSPLSHRCSGINHCTFILNHDYPDAELWPQGAVFIKYACVDDARSIKYCNLEVPVASESTPDSEGFVRSPGYPHYYIGDAKCRWVLQTPSDQRLRITLLDVALRDHNSFEPTRSCKDSLTISDGHSGEELLITCDQVTEPLIIESHSDRVEVLLRADSRDTLVYPKRGILFHYKSVGCATPPAPRDGYLVYRAPLVANFMCCVGYWFADIRRRERALRCLPDSTWDVPLPLPDCVVQSEPIWEGNVTRILPPTFGVDHPVEKDNTMFVDIVIPALLIAALFIGNAFIVLFIYRYRKRKDEDQDEFSGLTELNKNSGNAAHENGDPVNSV